MSRLQLALNVSNLDEAISFYSRTFATPPAKIRDGYANFEVADPPLKLVLFEKADAGGTLNHLGVEVSSTAEVTDFASRAADAGLEPTAVANTTCCFAEQDKTYVTDPDDLAWEVYVVLADALPSAPSDQVCCAD